LGDKGWYACGSVGMEGWSKIGEHYAEIDP